MTEAVVKQADFPVLIQDTGRQGVSRKGLSEGGAMDVHAHYWANKLLANDLNSASLEILVGACAFEFTANTVIAITGADLDVEINGSLVSTWCTHRVRAGDTLSFGRARSGLRAYLAVSGGWRTPVHFGSRSVVVRESIGGLNGAPLNIGDRLAFQPTSHSLARHVNARFIPDYQDTPTLQTVPGYQFDEFSPVQRALFGSSDYKISQRIDRMGYQLNGHPISAAQQSLISEGIALGAVQIPPDGQPIVLMKDRQTIGGYPKIGCVTSRSVARLSQCAPGDTVRFQFIDQETARSESILFERFFRVTTWHEEAGEWRWA